MSMLTAVRETLTGFKSLIIGMRITAREAAKPIITVQYPHDTLPMAARFRGHIQLTLDPETGKARCTACTLCAKACPSGCIDLDGIKREGDKKKSVSKYMLDFTKCSLCGSCVEICPSDAIEFSKQYNVVSLNRSTFDHIDLYQKIEKEAADWSKTHPTAAPAAIVAGLPEPGSAGKTPGSATPATTSPAAGPPGSATPATTTPDAVAPATTQATSVVSAPAADLGRAGTPLPATQKAAVATADPGAERSPCPTSATSVEKSTATPPTA